MQRRAQRQRQQQQVKVYTKRYIMNADISRMSRKGWVVLNVSTMLINRPMIKKILIGYLAKQRQQFTVLYQRA